MKRLLIVVLFFISGCSGIGLEKRTTLVPDSISLGYAQEQFKSDRDAWWGFTASATWELK